MSLPTYEATFKNDSQGVFSISLVGSPATEETFLALSKHTEIQFKEVDTEQRILIGLVLQPDQLIYRKQDGEEFNIVFREDTIKELSHNFFKSGFQLNSKLEHEEPIKDISIVESWLVENSEIDKSANFGMKYPKGSWLVTMKIDNDEIWNDFVKTGKVKGFSVDAMVDLKEVTLNTNIEMKNEILEAIKNGFALFSAKDQEVESEEIKLGSMASGDLEIFFDGEMLEVGGAVYVNAEDGTKVPLPVGDYPLDEGKVLVVAEEGIAGEVKEPEAELADDAPAPSNDAAQMEEITNAIKSIMIKYTEDFDNKLKAVTDANVELKAELVELSKEPAAKPVKIMASQAPLNAKGRMLNKLRNK